RPRRRIRSLALLAALRRAERAFTAGPRRSEHREGSKTRRKKPGQVLRDRHALGMFTRHDINGARGAGTTSSAGAKGPLQPIDEQVGVVVAEDQRRPDLQGSALPSGATDQHTPVPHAFDDPPGAVRV